MFRTKSLFIFAGIVTGFLFPGTSVSHAGLATGLEAYYQFNGNGLDSSGNGLNLNVVGNPSFGPGLFGQALSLDNNPSHYAILSADPTAFNFGFKSVLREFHLCPIGRPPVHASREKTTSRDKAKNIVGQRRLLQEFVEGAPSPDPVISLASGRCLLSMASAHNLPYRGRASSAGN
jgi:hypothetical protein